MNKILFTIKFLFYYLKLIYYKKDLISLLILASMEKNGTLKEYIFIDQEL